MKGKLINYAKVSSCVVPVLGNNTSEGTGVGVQVDGYDDVLMVWQQGISGDTLSGSLYWTLTFEESANNSSWTTIATADLIGGTGTHTIDAAAEDPTLVVRQYLGSKKYVRILATATGTHTNGTPIAALIILGSPRKLPVTQATELGTDS